MGTRPRAKGKRRDGAPEHKAESESLLELTGDEHEQPTSDASPSDRPDLAARLKSSSLLYVEPQAGSARSAEPPAGHGSRSYSYSHSRRSGRRRLEWRHWLGLGTARRGSAHRESGAHISRSGVAPQSAIGDMWTRLLSAMRRVRREVRRVLSRSDRNLPLALAMCGGILALVLAVGIER